VEGACRRPDAGVFAIAEGGECLGGGRGRRGFALQFDEEAAGLGRLFVFVVGGHDEKAEVGVAAGVEAEIVHGGKAGGERPWEQLLLEELKGGELVDNRGLDHLLSLLHRCHLKRLRIGLVVVLLCLGVVL